MAKKIDTALQWQHYDGSPFSQYGAAPQRNSLQVSVRTYF
jgi:hypothetical protein